MQLSTPLGRAAADLLKVQTHGHTACPHAEASCSPDDFGNVDALLVEVMDQFEEVILGLLRIDLALVTLVGNLAHQVHLVLLVVRELLVGRSCTAHHVVRVREQLAQARRDGYFEVSNLYNTALLQCETPIFNFLGVSRAV